MKQVYLTNKYDIYVVAVGIVDISRYQQNRLYSRFDPAFILLPVKKLLCCSGNVTCNPRIFIYEPNSSTAAQLFYPSQGIKFGK